MTETTNSGSTRPRRYVVLLHTHPTEGDHYDLMIEDGPALATWRVDRAPDSIMIDRPAGCTPIGDHRIAYLDYEGPVSGDRGHVTKHDSGTCTMLDRAASSIAIHFAGSRLQGDYRLEQVELWPDQWRLRLA